jgi:hypothetical protein
MLLQIEAILHHLLATVGTMFRRIALGFSGVFVVTVGLVEGAAMGLTGQVPPTGLTHVVAVVIGFSLGLNVALAIAIEEGLRGFIHLIKDVSKATEEGAKKLGQEILKDGGALVRAVEHEAGALAQGAGHLAQNVEHGAVTAARDATHLPGQLIGGAEGMVQQIERRLTGGQ